MRERVISVMGGTGLQGGGVVDALLAQGRLNVRVATRKPASDGARALSACGVEVVKACIRSSRGPEKPSSLGANEYLRARTARSLPFGVCPGRSLLHELHQRLVRLGPDDAVLPGDEGRHARDPVLARE